MQQFEVMSSKTITMHMHNTNKPTMKGESKKQDISIFKTKRILIEEAETSLKILKKPSSIREVHGGEKTLWQTMKYQDNKIEEMLQ